MSKLLVILPETNYQYEQRVYNDMCIYVAAHGESRMFFNSLEEAEEFLEDAARIDNNYRDIVFSYFLEKELID